MKINKIFFLGLLGLMNLVSTAQNVQSNALGTSGGFQAGTTTSGLGANTFYGFNCFSNPAYPNLWANTFIGANAGNYATGSQNVYIGANAGHNSSSGSRNVLIGSNSGNEERQHMGSGNVFIGNSSGFSESSSENKLVIGNDESVQLIWGDFAQNQLKFNGKVGVGFGFGNYPNLAGSIDVSKYNLFVKGGILTEEVRVSLTTTWADYVFKKDYKLPTLLEVEKQIQEKGHLFNVPSAQQVKEDGIELGEMAKIQQEKIEELTLYIIQMNKEIESLKVVVKSLTEKKSR